MNQRADLLRACIRETPVRLKLPFGFLALHPCAAADLAVAIERDASGTLRDVFSEGVDPGDDEFRHALEHDETVRAAFLGLALACARGWPGRFMTLLAFVRPPVFAHVALVALMISVPRDVTVLFPKRRPAPPAEEGEDEVETLPSWILRTMTRLRAAGHADADRMSLTRLAYAAMSAGHSQKEALRLAAIAARVGQADEKGWKKFEKAVA